MSDQSRCNQSPAEDHNFIVLTATWQVPNLMTGRTNNLEHSKQRLICQRCGKVVDAFPEMEVGKQS